MEFFINKIIENILNQKFIYALDTFNTYIIKNKI